MFSIFKLHRARGPADLVVDMAGVRLGERLLQAGVCHPRAFAIMAGKAGLTGRTCAVVDARAAAATLEAAAAAEGVFVEVTVAPGGAWPYDAASFDVGILDGNALLGASDGDRALRLADLQRVVRPGGRLLAIYRVRQTLAGRLGFEPATRQASREAQTLAEWLTTGGLKPVRILAEREGFAFVEGFRPGA
jgi:hypothetical protein